MLQYNGPNKHFIHFLDEYPIHFALCPSDFLNIIHLANIDYTQNQYSDTHYTSQSYNAKLSSCKLPRPIYRSNNIQNNDRLQQNDKQKKKNINRIVFDPIKTPRLRVNTPRLNAPPYIHNNRIPSFDRMNMSNSHGPLSIIIPTTFSLPDIISPGKISIPDNNITATPEDTTEEDQPIYEITDPVETISDFISIIDKYDVNKKYNMDVRLLSNIRKELVDLNGMIGMETLKKSVFNQLIYFIQGLHLRKDPDASIHTHGDFKHTVIYGPPGTGKTEVAKIIGRMYANLGVLQKGVFKKVTRNDLVAGYLGQTAIKTTNVINDCLGGVLFIDEAYSLSNSPDLDSFSKECLDTLCEALSNHKEDLMVIIAGYEEELNEHFFKANRGLDSRFVWRFKIDPYNSNELSEIFKKKVSESGWCFETEKTIDTKWFDQFKSSFHHYGRDMEMLFFYTKISHSRRVFGKPATLQRVLTKEDVENGYALFLKNTKQKDNTTRKIFETMYI